MTMHKKTTADRDSAFFWNNASGFLNSELPDIRQKSPNTVETYRRSLNRYIDFLESEKSIKRKDICYQDFNKNNLKDYLLFMKDTRKLSEKTCNLRMTAIRALLAYAAEESIDITTVYVNAKTVKGLPIPQKEIEYFENGQLKILLAAPPRDTKVGRRDRMLLDPWLRCWSACQRTDRINSFITPSGCGGSICDDSGKRLKVQKRAADGQDYKPLEGISERVSSYDKDGHAAVLCDNTWYPAFSFR